MRYALLSLALCSANATASLPQSETPICPDPDQLHCVPYFHNCEQDKTVYCSGTWRATNLLNKLFATRTDVDCRATVQKWLPDASQVVNGYQVRCVYELVDPYGITYRVTLYNEKGYTLIDDELVPTSHND